MDGVSLYVKQWFTRPPAKALQYSVCTKIGSKYNFTTSDMTLLLIFSCRALSCNAFPQNTAPACCKQKLGYQVRRSTDRKAEVWPHLARPFRRVAKALNGQSVSVCPWSPTIHTVRRGWVWKALENHIRVERPQRRHGLFFNRNLIIFHPLSEIENLYRRGRKGDKKTAASWWCRPLLLFASLSGITYAEVTRPVSLIRTPFNETRHLNGKLEFKKENF